MSDPNEPQRPNEPSGWASPEPNWEPTTQQQATTQNDSFTDSTYSDPPLFTHESAESSAKGSSGSSKKWVAVAIVAAIVGGIVGGGVSAAMNDDAEGPKATTVASTASQASNTPATPNAIRSVLDKVQPAVVSIQGSAQGGTESGTGMILTEDGVILTNAHVVSGVAGIRVTLNGERNARSAKLVASDPTIDSAIIKLDNAKDLPTVSFGESSSIQVGDEVVAIGNALALPGGPTVTTGIISAKDRSIEQLDNLIQTDAAINPGNSGGPLVNMAGQVVGMNTAVIRGDNGTFQNIGFALAIDSVKPAIPDLEAGKTTQQAYMGVSALPMSTQLKARLEVPVDEGAVVNEVTSGSPADKAGLGRFDVITEVDGQEITDNQDLVTQVRSHKPGDRVKVVYYRGADKREATVELAVLPPSNNQ